MPRNPQRYPQNLCLQGKWMPLTLHLAPAPPGDATRRAGGFWACFGPVRRGKAPSAGDRPGPKTSPKTIFFSKTAKAGPCRRGQSESPSRPGTSLLRSSSNLKFPGAASLFHWHWQPPGRRPGKGGRGPCAGQAGHSCVMGVAGRGRRPEGALGGIPRGWRRRRRSVKTDETFGALDLRP